MNIEPSVNDVLLGRGRVCYRHDGNKRWSVRIGETFEEYDAADNVGKVDIARGVVLEVPKLVPPGRFLKKNKEDDQWYALNLKDESVIKDLIDKARRDYNNERAERKKVDGIDEVKKCLDVVNDLTAKLEEARAKLEKARQEHKSDIVQSDGSDEEHDGANPKVGAENKEPPLEDMVGKNGLEVLNAAMQKAVQDGGNPKAAAEDDAPQDVLPPLPPLAPPRFGFFQTVKSMGGFSGLDARLGDPPTFFEELDAATASVATMSISEPNFDDAPSFGNDDRKKKARDECDNGFELIPPALLAVLYSIVELVEESSSDHVVGPDEQVKDILGKHDMKEAIKAILRHKAKKLRGLSYEAQRAAAYKLNREDGKTMKISVNLSGKSVQSFKALTDLPKLEIVEIYRIKDDRYYTGSILEGEPHGRGVMVYDKGADKGKVLCGDWYENITFICCHLSPCLL
mmetsp:Transcript_33606/g.81433  ORF Transcript_33606/g.81433 Transcript_33606/m.81433 type:complete len:456 (+) Transcript_33606:43-1410(+)